MAAEENGIRALAGMTKSRSVRLWHLSHHLSPGFIMRMHLVNGWLRTCQQWWVMFFSCVWLAVAQDLVTSRISEKLAIRPYLYSSRCLWVGRERDLRCYVSLSLLCCVGLSFHCYVSLSFRCYVSLSLPLYRSSSPTKNAVVLRLLTLLLFVLY